MIEPAPGRFVLRLDRRGFLRRAGALGLAASALPLVACVEGAGDGAPGADAGDGGTGPGTRDAGAVAFRPILLPFGEDGVRVHAPVSVRPLAYVSRGNQHVYVDDDFADRVVGLLNIHVSVSTGLWRIPLPGDRPEQPLIPGDEEREFVKAPAREWDPTRDPTEGDFRIMPGRCRSFTLVVDCEPIQGRDEWASAERVTYGVCSNAEGGECREDFAEVAAGTRYADRECTEPVGTLRYLAWSCLEL